MFFYQDALPAYPHFGYDLICGQNFVHAVMQSPRNMLILYNVQELFVAIFSFFLPALILFFTYGHILYVLIKRNKQNDILTDDKDVTGFTRAGEERRKGRKNGSTSERQTKRATIMCFVCLATYILLWFLYHGSVALWKIAALMDIREGRQGSKERALVDALNLSYHLLSVYNAIGSLFAFINPMIYCGMNQQWITAGKYLFGCKIREESGTSSTKHNRVTFKIDESSVSGAISALSEQVETDTPMSANVNNIHATVYHRQTLQQDKPFFSS